MPAGTITLTNGSTTVTGSGTSFTSELKAGDFIYVMVGGAPYTLVASAVGSNTQVTLAVAYDGPTSSGLAWVAAPALMQAAITQKILNDFATVARGRILDFQNWQKIYSDAQSVTVTRPDRTTFTGPSWGYMATQFSNKLDKAKSLDDLTDKVTAWNNIARYGSSANTAAQGNDTRIVNAMQTTGGQFSGRVDFSSSGLAVFRGGVNVYDTTSYFNSQVFIGNAGNEPLQLGPGGSGGNTWLHFTKYGGSDGWRIGVLNETNLYIKYYGSGGNGATALNLPYGGVIYSSSNTTKASDGTLKAASPVARIVQCKNITERGDVDEAGFAWCGCGTANAEAEGISIKRFDTGIYILTGSAGLAKEGWQLLPPRDPQGSGDLGIVEAEETESGGLKISLYKRRYRLNDENGDIEVAKGDLIDVPVSSWIDVRLKMPEDSVFNLKQKAMLEAAEKAEIEPGS